MKIGFDTSALSSLIKMGEKDTSDKIKQPLHDNKNDDLEIVISNIVYSEIMSHATPQEAKNLTHLLKNIANITYLPFDKKSAVMNARLVENIGLKSAKKNRQTVKADFLIVANNDAYGCDIFLTSDKDLLTKLHGHPTMKLIDIGGLPLPPTP